MLLAAMCCAIYSVATEARDLDVYLSYSIDMKMFFVPSNRNIGSMALLELGRRAKFLVGSPARALSALLRTRMIKQNITESKATA